MGLFGACLMSALCKVLWMFHPACTGFEGSFPCDQLFCFWELHPHSCKNPQWKGKPTVGHPEGFCELLDVTFLSVASSSLAFKTLCCFVSSLSLFYSTRMYNPVKILYTKHDSLLPPLFKKNYFAFACICEFLHIRMYAIFMPSVQTGHKSGSEPLELEVKLLWAATWVLGTKPRILQE